MYKRLFNKSDFVLTSGLFEHVLLAFIKERK